MVSYVTSETRARRRFVSRSGRELDFTSLGLGSAPLGNLYRAIPDDEARATVNEAWHQGVRYYDTAPLYGYGLAEVRVGSFLRTHARDDFLLSTKVGRVLQRCAPEERDGIGKFFDVPSRRVIYDYSYDGVMRSFEMSFERLGFDRIDIVFGHDIDVFTHGSKEASAQRTREFLDGGVRALADLRSQGVIGAIGIGVNEWEVCEVVARHADVDLFLLAGRYTLLEQQALETFLPLCEAKGMGIVVGGPLNSGILATGAKPGAWFNYSPAPQDVLDRVARIERVCAAHGVSLRDAALQFPLMHPCVVSVIPGAVTAEEIRSNVRSLTTPIPPQLWADLKHEGLLREDAPVIEPQTEKRSA
ncbi:aldo/keto reductase [Caballeronia sp. INDeC2]|uniref:aldo/keto reductase n=1 Tax=Caballeronia sp. INDeC2 TaxID=2921747 RepID=UPI002028EA31